jgi:acyl-CoA dehydrogenase
MNELSNIVLEQADRLFQQHATKDTLAAADRGEWPESLWHAVDEAGLLLALVPEKSGGVGLGSVDVANLIRRAAYYSVPLPLAETMIANQLWVEAGGEVLTGAVTLAPSNPRDRITLTRNGNEVVLHGTAHHVPWGLQCENTLVFARDEADRGVFCLVPRDQSRPNKGRRNIAYEPRDQLNFEGVTLPIGRINPATEHLQRNGFLLYGAAIRVQQMIGGMERCLDHALSYANERVQFGRPIGKFQAVQHMLAVAAGHFAAASAAADAMLESKNLADDLFAVAVAKSRAGEAAGQVAATCHQVHGAMGFTQEHPLHFATRRLWAWRDEWGAESYWQEQIGRIICDKGGEGFWPFLTDARENLETGGLPSTLGR